MFSQYFFLDTFVGRRAFPINTGPRYVSWNNYNLDTLEAIMIEKSFLTNGELIIPEIDKSAL